MPGTTAGDPLLRRRRPRPVKIIPEAPNRTDPTVVGSAASGGSGSAAASTDPALIQAYITHGRKLGAVPWNEEGMDDIVARSRAALEASQAQNIDALNRALSDKLAAAIAYEQAEERYHAERARVTLACPPATDLTKRAVVLRAVWHDPACEEWNALRIRALIEKADADRRVEILRDRISLTRARLGG